jgi:hypothetical protein
VSVILLCGASVICPPLAANCTRGRGSLSNQREKKGVPTIPSDLCGKAFVSKRMSGKNDAGARTGAGLDIKLNAMLQLGGKGCYTRATLCSVTRARKTQRLREVK